MGSYLQISLSAQVTWGPRCQQWQRKTDNFCGEGLRILPFPKSKVHGANMGFIWGRQDQRGPHVDPMNFAIWVVMSLNWRIEYLISTTHQTTVLVHDWYQYLLAIWLAISVRKFSKLMNRGFSRFWSDKKFLVVSQINLVGIPIWILNSWVLITRHYWGSSYFMHHFNCVDLILISNIMSYQIFYDVYRNIHLYWIEF